MARNLGVDRRTMVRWMVRLDVQRRPYAEAIELLRKTRGISKEILSDLYYGQKLSISQIGSRFGVTYTAIWKLMERYSIPRRTTSEAGQKYPKHPFKETALVAAYLLGFRTGDLHAVRSGNQVRFSTSSTHPAMSRLFESLFGKHGRVGKTPTFYNGLYEWANYCYLDNSFEFLLEKPTRIPANILNDDELFLAFLAGYLDAEGNFRIYRRYGAVAFALRVNSEDEHILRGIARKLRMTGYHVSFKLGVESGPSNKYLLDMWSLGMYRKAEILQILKRLPLMHDEKTRWRNLMLESSHARWNLVSAAVSQLRIDILKERSDYMAMAELAYKHSHMAGAIGRG